MRLRLDRGGQYPHRGRAMGEIADDRRGCRGGLGALERYRVALKRLIELRSSPEKRGIRADFDVPLLMRPIERRVEFRLQIVSKRHRSRRCCLKFASCG